MKGSFPLTDYRNCTVLPTNKEDGNELIVRMNSTVSEKANVVVDLK